MKSSKSGSKKAGGWRTAIPTGMRKRRTKISNSPSSGPSSVENIYAQNPFNEE